MIDKLQMFLASLNGSDKTGKNAAAKNGKADNHNVGGLNADQFGLSEDARNKVIWANSQFQVNYQVLKSVNGANGYNTSEESFSLHASYRFLQMASGADEVSAQTETPSSEKTANEESGEVAPADETSDDNLLTRLQEYFSPENTARRILDVATSFFSLSDAFKNGGDTEAARQTFADFIGGAIEQGFSAARGILGEIPEDVSAGIDKTHSLVFSGLEDFVSNGIDPEKATAGGVFDKIAAYREEGRARLGEVVRLSSGGSYNSSGEVQKSAPDSGKILTTG